MQPNNNTDPHHSGDSHCYQSQSQSQHPSSLIYDPASSYINYNKDESDMYPTMSMMPGVIVESDIHSNNNGHFANGELPNNDLSHCQQGSCNSHINNHDNNLIVDRSHFLQTNNIMPTYPHDHVHEEGNGQSTHFVDYAYSRKRPIQQCIPSSGNSAGYAYCVSLLHSPTNTSLDPKPPKTDKASKGLRHFSMKVCEKVQQKKITTYNEVADELVQEFGESDKGPGNEQNIRRRVYDALNVLMAMNIISKDKKEIRWLGLPSNSAQEHQRLHNEGNEMYDSVKEKLRIIYELIIQQVSLQNLIVYNKSHENEVGCAISSDSCIQLPFLAITTSQTTDVICRINDQKNKYDISFSSDFELNDDSEILKRLGFSCNLDSPHCTLNDLNRSLQLVPPNLSYYVRAMAGRSLAQFQDHILQNRGYLNHDDVMEFYNRINRSAFECAPGNNNIKTDISFTSSSLNDRQNIDKLNSNSVGHYTYNHNSPFPLHDHSGSNSNNDHDPTQPFETTVNETYSLSSPINNAHSSNSNETPRHESKESFVQVEHRLSHIPGEHDHGSDSIKYPEHNRF